MKALYHFFCVSRAALSQDFWTLLASSESTDLELPTVCWNLVCMCMHADWLTDWHHLTHWMRRQYIHVKAKLIVLIGLWVSLRSIPYRCSEVLWDVIRVKSRINAILAVSSAGRRELHCVIIIRMMMTMTKEMMRKSMGEGERESEWERKWEWIFFPNVGAKQNFILPQCITALKFCAHYL